MKVYTSENQCCLLGHGSCGPLVKHGHSTGIIKRQVRLKRIM